VPENIYKRIPDCRILTILRHPVERAFSHYSMLCQSGFSDLSFAEYIEKGRNGKNFIDTVPFLHSFYGRHLSRYFDFFQPDQIGIWLYEDFERDSKSVTQEMFEFVGVDAKFVPETTIQFNQRFHSHNPAVRKFIKQDTVLLRLARRILAPDTRANLRYRVENMFKSGEEVQKEQLSDSLKSELSHFYENDILDLQRLIGRDLSHWLA
jgi:hypothetical protein